MTTFDNIFCLKKPTQFYCDVCDYKSSYSRDYKRHLLTKKHKNNEIAQNNNELGPNLPKNIKFQKVFWVFKNGQKKCPKSKT